MWVFQYKHGRICYGTRQRIRITKTRAFWQTITTVKKGFPTVTLYRSTHLQSGHIFLFFLAAKEPSGTPAISSRSSDLRNENMARLKHQREQLAFYFNVLPESCED